MQSLGSLPTGNYSSKIIESIGENIIVADVDYNITWLNPKAVELLNKIIPIFDIENIEDLIGMNMSHFQKNPEYQKEIMKNLTHSHSSRINIKNKYIADIIINPIKEEEIIIGYVVMLMDVTTVVQEERRKERIIHELSGPILHVWDHTLALPIIGILDEMRYDIIFNKLLKECADQKIQYVIIDFSSIKDWSEETPHQIQKIIGSLALMGIQCMMVGISPSLARSLSISNTYDVPVLATTKAAIKQIISQSEDA